MIRFRRSDRTCCRCGACCLGKSSGVVCNRLRDVERRIFAAHVVGAHFAFRDDARNRGFETAIEDTLIRLDDVTR